MESYLWSNGFGFSSGQHVELDDEVGIGHERPLGSGVGDAGLSAGSPADETSGWIGNTAEIHAAEAGRVVFGIGLLASPSGLIGEDRCMVDGEFRLWKKLKGADIGFLL